MYAARAAIWADRPPLPLAPPWRVLTRDISIQTPPQTCSDRPCRALIKGTSNAFLFCSSSLLLHIFSSRPLPSALHPGRHFHVRPSSPLLLHAGIRTATRARDEITALPPAPHPHRGMQKLASAGSVQRHHIDVGDCSKPPARHGRQFHSQPTWGPRPLARRPSAIFSRARSATPRTDLPSRFSRSPNLN